MEQNNKSSKVGIILAVVVIVIGIAVGALVLMQKPGTKEPSKNDTSSTTTTNTNNSNQAGSSSAATTDGTVITFTDDGFDKAEYTSKAGDAVTVKNASSMDLQFSSDDHPAHRDHPELNEDVLSPGQSTTFTPNGTGSFGFHDHLHDQYTGVLIVE